MVQYREQRNKVIKIVEPPPVVYQIPVAMQWCQWIINSLLLLAPAPPNSRSSSQASCSSISRQPLRIRYPQSSKFSPQKRAIAAIINYSTRSSNRWCCWIRVQMRRLQPTPRCQPNILSLPRQRHWHRWPSNFHSSKPWHSSRNTLQHRPASNSIRIVPNPNLLSSNIGHGHRRQISVEVLSPSTMPHPSSQLNNQASLL